jgi:hypothetical protein
MFKKYRKKPVVIEAIQFEGDLYVADKIKEWSRPCNGHKPPVDFESTNNGIELIIETLEGNMRARKGDWIIKGVNGEFYPCKDDAFKKTYDEV